MSGRRVGIRVGPSPLTTRFVDVFDGMAAIADVVRGWAP